MVLLQGNEACVLGALKAGMRFFAGYPITPSSEIAEQSSILLPKHDGKFIQMEDEIASMAAVIGASLTGLKVMTATSGPGFSLKQELIGYASMAETPVVIASIMRMGPSTGLPTSPAQGDVMQAKWGTHGDHPVICVCPTSVREMYELTITAFNYAEKYRTPVILMTDEVIAHMREGVTLTDDVEIIDRKTPDTKPSPDYLPYGVKDGEDVPPMAPYGTGYKFHVTGLAHNETGFPTNSPAVNEALVKRLCSKVEDHVDDIVINETFFTDDCEHLVVAYGSVARASLYAVRKLREEGVKIGLFVPKVLWPFPEKALKAVVGDHMKSVIVPEMNLGQYDIPVRGAVSGVCPVHQIPKVSGELFGANELKDKIQEVVSL
jgi:2-oxoglutarate ferredoxin oxidoreductase subunit alpha